MLSPFISGSNLTELPCNVGGNDCSPSPHQLLWVHRANFAHTMGWHNNWTWDTSQIFNGMQKRWIRVNCEIFIIIILTHSNEMARIKPFFFENFGIISVYSFHFCSLQNVNHVTGRKIGACNIFWSIFRLTGWNQNFI